MEKELRSHPPYTRVSEVTGRCRQSIGRVEGAMWMARVEGSVVQGLRGPRVEGDESCRARVTLVFPFEDF